MGTPDFESSGIVAEFQGEIPVAPKWATTDDDWNPRRSLIKHLYLEEGKTLKEVMLVMERSHHFKATVKMYKNRITKWGLDKRCKETEMKAIVRIEKVRAAGGKRSEFQLRGCPVDLREVARYLKRKSLEVETIVMEKTSGLPNPLILECLTPPPVPSSPRPPQVLEIPEYIFSNIRDYFLGSFGAGTWVTDSDILDCFSTKPQGNEMTALKSLFSHHDVACKLLEKQSFEEAGRVLIKASAGIKSILSAEHPRTLGALFDLIMYLRSRQRPELALILLRQFADMAAVVLPPRHPLSQICASLTSLDAAHFESVITTAWQSALDRFDAIIGAMHYTTLRSHLEYIQMVESIQGFEHAEALLRRLVTECKAKCGLADTRTLKLLDTLGETLLDQGKYAEAEDLAWDVIINAPLVNPLSKAVDISAAGLFISARAHHALGRVELAVEMLERAININASMWGWQNALTMKYLVFLEDWLMEWGKEEAAGEIRVRRLSN